MPEATANSRRRVVAIVLGALFLILILVAGWFWRSSSRRSYHAACIQQRCGPARISEFYERYQPMLESYSVRLEPIVGSTDSAQADRMLLDFAAAGHPVNPSHIL